MELLRARVLPDRVELEWYSATLAVSVARALRREEASPWQEAGLVEFDGSGHGVLIDRFIARPGRYHWLLTSTDGSETLSSLAVVEAAERAGLALRVASPKPATTGMLRARLSLPDASPATLEVIDVAGRITETKRIAGLTGELTVSLDFRTSPPGLYWLRLTQGGRSAAARVVLVR